MKGLDQLFFRLYRLRATVQQLLSDDAAALFNDPGRKDSASMEKTLVSGLANGLVRLRGRDNEPLSQDDVAGVLNRGFTNSPFTDTYVELTRKGGALWEKRAAPMWKYFVDEGEPLVLRGTVWISFEARSSTWLSAVEQTLSRSGFLKSNRRKTITLRPWLPVYWRKFSLGYCLKIDTKHHRDSELGQRFLQGIGAADERSATTFSTLAGIWDAKWVSNLNSRRSG
jgi:hypothetical protein